MTLARCRMEFKVEDMWVGAFWKHTDIKIDDETKRFATDIWICLIPCVPLHLTFLWNCSISH